MEINKNAIVIGAVIIVVLVISVILAAPSKNLATASDGKDKQVSLSPRPPAPAPVCPAPPIGRCTTGTQTCVEGTVTYACEYNCNAAGQWVQGAICGGQNCNGNECLGSAIGGIN